MTIGIPNFERLVLDAHGVVFSNSFRKFLRALESLIGHNTGELWQRWLREIRHPAWSGELTEMQIWERLGASRFRQAGAGLLNHAFDLGPASSHLQVWRRRVPIWLLSNHRTEWLHPRLEQFGLQDCFERVLVSDQMGFVKPDERAFLQAISGLDPHRVLVVDDKPQNVRVARQLGTHAILASPTANWTGEITDLLAGERSFVSDV